MPNKDYGGFDQPSEQDTAHGAHEADDGKTEPSLGERLAETAGGAGDPLRGSAERVGEAAEDTIKEATERGERVIELISRYAREQPLAGLALAFVAGVALTSLLKR
jgi:hypothetical protein